MPVLSSVSEQQHVASKRHKRSDEAVYSIINYLEAMISR